MRSIGLPVIILAVMLSTLLAACAVQEISKEPSAKQVQQESQEALEAMKAYALEKKAAYAQQVESKLDELEVQIVDLRDEAEADDAQADSDLNEDITALEDKVETIRGDLEEFRTASAEAWKDLEGGINAALEELEVAYDQAVSRFSEG